MPGLTQSLHQYKRSGGVAVAGLMERPDGMNMPPFWAMLAKT
jgi:hypothetical protein